MTFFRENLHRCLQYYLWGDPQTSDNIRMLYAKRTPFPFNFYYPQKYATQVNCEMQLLEQFSIDDKLEDHQIEHVMFFLLFF